MNPRTLLAALLLSAVTSHAKPTLKWTPPVDETERPLATEVTVGPQGTEIALKVVFNKQPWGEECKNRCANFTLFLDTDNNKGTGLQLGDKNAETGADLAVNIQGARDYRENSVEVLLKVKVRLLANDATSVEQGELLEELDSKRDPERIETEGETVFVLVDATHASIPSAKQMRVIYHPPGHSAVKGSAPGMLATGKGKVEVFKAGKKSGR